MRFSLLCLVPLLVVAGSACADDPPSPTAPGPFAENIDPGGDGGAAGAAGAPAVDPPERAETQRLFKKLLEEENVPGGSFAVVHAGKVAFTGATGIRHVGEPAKVDAQTYFRLASVTKTFTSVLVHTFVDEGKLDRSARVVDVAPAFHARKGEDASAITIEQLLLHTSGLGDFSQSQCVISLSSFFERNNPSEIEVWSPAGRLWNYANPNYAALGYVTEKIGGKPYTELLQTRVLDPIGMKASTFDSDLVVASDNYAIGNVAVSDSKWADGDTPDDTCPVSMPYGDLWSNAEDMGIFAAELLAEAPHVLAPGTFREMAQGRVATLLRPNELDGYGLFETQYKGLRVVSHDGGIDGIATTLWLLPERDLGIVLLLNTNASTETIAGRMADSLLGLTPGEEPFYPPPDIALYPEYVGDYDAGHQLQRFRISTNTSADKLYFQFLTSKGKPEGAEQEMIPYAMESFVFDVTGDGGYLSATFWRDVEASGAGTYFATRVGTGIRTGDVPLP
jgi:CubicO group peptidase (beta-lactamase class C family)